MGYHGKTVVLRKTERLLNSIVAKDHNTRLHEYTEKKKIGVKSGMTKVTSMASSPNCQNQGKENSSNESNV